MSYRLLFFHVSFFLLAEKNAILFTLRTFYRKHVVKYFVRKAMRFVLMKYPAIWYSEIQNQLDTIRRQMDT